MPPAQPSDRSVKQAPEGQESAVPDYHACPRHCLPEPGPAWSWDADTPPQPPLSIPGPLAPDRQGQEPGLTGRARSSASGARCCVAFSAGCQGAGAHSNLIFSSIKWPGCSPGTLGWLSPYHSHGHWACLVHKTTLRLPPRLLSKVTTWVPPLGLGLGCPSVALPHPAGSPLTLLPPPPRPGPAPAGRQPGSTQWGP